MVLCAHYKLLIFAGTFRMVVPNVNSNCFEAKIEACNHHKTPNKDLNKKVESYDFLNGNFSKCMFGLWNVSLMITCQIVCVVAQKLSQENGTKMKRANPGITSRTIFASSTL